MKFDTRDDYLTLPCLASHLQLGDVFETYGYIGACISPATSSEGVVLFEWQATPAGCESKIWQQERLSAATVGKACLRVWQFNRRPPLVGELFVTGSLLWICSSEGARLLSWTGDAEYQKTVFDTSGNHRIVDPSRVEVVLYALRQQYVAFGVPFPEEYLSSIKKEPVMASPELSTLLKDIPKFPKKVLAGCAKAYGVPEGTLTFHHLMLVSWENLFVTNGGYAGPGGNNGSGALAVMLESWGYRQADMGAHFVPHFAQQADTATADTTIETTEETPSEESGQAEEQPEVGQVAQDGIPVDMQMLAFIRQTYPDFMDHELRQLGAGYRTVRGSLEPEEILLSHISTWTWEELYERAGADAAGYIFGALQGVVGETAEFPIGQFLADTEPQAADPEPEAPSEEQTDSRSSWADLLAIDLSSYFDLTEAVERINAGQPAEAHIKLTDLTGESIAGWSRDDLATLFPEPEGQSAFLVWIAENFDLEGAVAEDGSAIFNWFETPSEESEQEEAAEEAQPEPDAQLEAVLAAYYQLSMAQQATFDQTVALGQQS